MRRRLFFLLDQLKITPAERKAVTGLFSLLLVLVTLNAIVTPSARFGDADYAELDAHFRQRSDDLKARQAQIMQRYYPPSEAEAIAAADTILPDTLKQARRQSPFTGGEDSPAGILRVNINTASEEVLQTLPGIGPVYARRIVEYRREIGSFTRPGELKNIRGIGEKRLDKLKPFIKLTDSD